METKKRNKALICYLLIILIAVARAFLNEIFVYPNNFAPSGISGIATMVQYVFGLRVGYFSLVVNIPLFILAYKICSKSFALRGGVYVLFSAIANIIFKTIDFSAIAFIAQDTGEEILAAVAAGVCGGLEFSTCILLGGSTGGTDFLSAVINKKNPAYDFVWIGFAINSLVAVASFFVYGMKYTPVILCIVYIFVNTKLADYILKGTKTAVKFEVFTNNPEAMSKELMEKLRHGCTVLNATGMYSHKDLSLLICVVNKHQIVDFQDIIAKYPGSFAVISSVNSTYGNFRKVK